MNEGTMRRIVGATIGRAVRLRGSHGDLWSAAWADDDELYVASDDTFGFDRAADSNLAVNRVIGAIPPDLAGITVNPMWAYGRQTEYRADDGMWKATGIASVDGSLYLGVSRHAHPLGNPFFIQETWDASIIRSDDHGRTWSRMPTLTRPMFRGHGFSTPFFVQYGRDGAADVDEADRYLYAISSDGAWNNGNAMTLGRVGRDRLSALDARDWEFFHGLDDGRPIWRPRHDTARYVFRSPGRTSMTGLHHVTGIGSYILPQWHFPNLDDDARRWHTSRLELYQAPHPWGPFRMFHRQDFRQSWYNPAIPAKFISQDGRSMWLFLGGDFMDFHANNVTATEQSYYGLWMAPLSLALEGDPPQVG
jgi:hypothetical protein